MSAAKAELAIAAALTAPMIILRNITCPIFLLRLGRMTFREGRDTRWPNSGTPREGCIQGGKCTRNFGSFRIASSEIHIFQLVNGIVACGWQSGKAATGGENVEK
jgi:hypothetical protein